jgi:N-acetylglucosamine-6-sulfatase
MSSRARPFLPIAGALVIVVGILVIVRVNADKSAPGPAAAVPRASRTGGAPNILMIMTDDETLESIRVLDNVDRYIVDQGTSFTNFFVAFPNCCPSRTTYMTGMYPHNHGVKENIAPAGGFHKANQTEYLPVWMQRAGYWTASVGKYLNEYGADGNITPPAGWTHWFGLIDPTTYRYYNYSVSNDGQRVDYGTEPKDYQTDVLGGEVVRIIGERATGDQPWFLSWTPLAPHSTEGEGASGLGTGDQLNNREDNSVAGKIRSSFPVPAPEFQGKMARENLPRPASFDEQDISDKPEFFREKSRFFPNSVALMREGYQRELESLLSVDKWVRKIFDTLLATNQAANTTVIFTSDNGYYHGEHRLSFSKVYLYEQGVHLPLVIRGAGFPKGAKQPALASNVDLAPTILGLAGAKATTKLDGRDLTTVVKDPAVIAGRGILLENWRDNGTKHTDGVRTDRYKYLVNDAAEEELYDLQADPDELDNRAADPALASTKAQLIERLKKLRTCAGATCEGAQPDQG